ncbi:MAG: TIGR03862 family flavoprotein [Candidatus Promineifilaceae bacterium]
MRSGAVVVGGGPAGLMAAEIISGAGIPVAVYDSMRSVGRKFLLAGKGGLNLTHSEPMARFLTRYGDRQAELTPYIGAFSPTALRQWAADLGIETFIGSSGRVFPTEMKAAPLLRAWLTRLRRNGVIFHMRHRWLGWDENGRLHFSSPTGDVFVRPRPTVLALGGGSWPKLGSTGSWTEMLAARGVAVAPLQPANCGFLVEWSDHFRTRFAGQPVKTVAARLSPTFTQQGEFIITDYGVEGSLIYAASAQLRNTVAANGSAVLFLDLSPDRSERDLRTRLARPRGSISQANHWRRQIGLVGVKAGLLRECATPDVLADPARLAALIKRLPLRLGAPRPLAEAISSAGGVAFSAVDVHLQLHAIPGVFCAGEMLDWEAPTGGYLLTACMATGRAAGSGVVGIWNSVQSPSP